MLKVAISHIKSGFHDSITSTNIIITVARAPTHSRPQRPRSFWSATDLIFQACAEYSFLNLSQSDLSDLPGGP